jgi:hypothetical protein
LVSLLSLSPALHISNDMPALSACFQNGQSLQTCKYQGMTGWQWNRALDGHRRGSWWVTDGGFLSDIEGHMICIWWICDSPHGAPHHRHNSQSRSSMQDQSGWRSQTKL